MKKILMLLAFMPILASAIEVNKVFYSLDYSNNTAEVAGCDDELGSATIPATITDEEGYTYTVTSIGDNAFSEHFFIRSVELPNTIISIGKSAFYKIKNFTYINIPNSVKSIGDKAFMDCAKLSTVDVGRNSTLTSIGSNAFNGCSSLRSFYIPNSVESIGAGAFRYCSAISSINIPTSLKSIETCAFSGTAIQSATIPSSVTKIGSYAFGRCTSLTTVTIPNSVTTIEGEAFSGCTSLASVSIPNSVTSIEYNTFYGCISLTSVTIGDGVTSIGKSAFENCTSLASLTIGSSVASIGEKAFYKCSALHSLTIPNSVTTLGESAFDGCSGLASVTIPKSVTTIRRYVFLGCTGELTVNCNIPSVYSSGDGKFYGSKFSSVKIGDDVETVGDYAFYWCESLTSVTIGNSVKTIGEKAFYWCSGLTEITIPNSVTTIGESAFSNCSALISVTIPKSVTSIGSSAFRDCTGELNVNCNIPSTTGNSVFSGSKFSSVIIGDDVETVGDYAFYGSSNLTSVTIGNGVKTIGENAFRQISNITSLTIGNSVTSIGKDAFCGCSGLTEVTIPNSVITIGNDAFYNCSGLTSVSIGNSVTSIGDWAFYNCQKLTSLTIPNSVTTIGKYAFDDCSGLTKVTIGKSVTTIGSMAFYGWAALTDIYNYATTPQDTYFSNYSATLHVRPGCGDAYRAASAWKDFQTIVEDATDGGPVEKPKLSLSASPSGGDVTAGTKVYLTAKANSSEVSGASIYYTLNGTTPSKNSTAYTSSGITIDASCTLKAIAYKEGYEDSDVMEESFTVTNHDNHGIAINETNFPDANFRKYLLEQDYGSDGVLTETEIAGITNMSVYEAGIESLEGIGYFKELVYLDCTDNQLTSLDVSGCPMLNFLYCNGNQLSSLDVSGCSELYLLYVYQNQIKGSAMDALIESLSTTSIGEMAVVYNENEGNVMTEAQVAAAKAKGWTPQYYNGTEWIEYEGGDGEPAEKSDVYLVSVTCDNQNLDQLTNSDKLIFHATFGNDGAEDEIPSAIMLLSEDAKRVLASGEYEWTVVKKGEQVTVDYEYALDTIPQGQYKATVLYYDWNEEVWRYSSRFVYTINVGNSPAKGTEESPFTPAEANEYGRTLASNEQSDKDYYIRGRISSVREQFNTQYGNATFNISLDGSENDQFHVFRALYLGNTKYAGQDLLPRVGDDVVVCGKITNYLGSLPETVEEKAYVVSINGIKAETSVKGDVNQDNAVNTDDLITLSDIIIGRSEKTKAADVNGDGEVNIADLVMLVNMLTAK